MYDKNFFVVFCNVFIGTTKNYKMKCRQQNNLSNTNIINFYLF